MKSVKQPPNSSVHSGTVCHRHHVTRRCVGANSTGIRGRAFRAGCECANFPRYRYADCERARERRADGTCGAGRGLVSCGFSSLLGGECCADIAPRPIAMGHVHGSRYCGQSGLGLGLAFASVLTWTIWSAKAIELLIVRRRMQATIDALSQARSWSEASARIKGRNDGSAALVRAADAELRLSADALSPSG